jgi:hypothetical protein
MHFIKNIPKLIKARLFKYKALRSDSFLYISHGADGYPAAVIIARDRSIQQGVAA